MAVERPFSRGDDNEKHLIYILHPLSKLNDPLLPRGRLLEVEQATSKEFLFRS